MKVAFIEPSISNVEPLGIAYLAQSLINAGHEVKYFETPRPNFIDRLKDFNPDVLAYSVTTGKHQVCQNLNAMLRKEINAISLFGGPHCTFFPEFIESEELIDGVCQGEGEYAMVELLERIKEGKDCAQTENWWLRIDGKIYKNSVRTKVENLDTLPFPNREIIYAENTDLRETPIKRVIGSRGCPFACSYCFNKNYNIIYQGKGQVYRQRSVKNIVQEILAIKKKWPLTFLKFTEDVFGLGPGYGEEFAETYGKEVSLPFICNIRPNLITAEKIKLLKKAGCVAVTLAIESGNEFVRNKILNRNLSSDLMDRAITILKNENLRVYTQNIIANPGETFEMAMETFNLNVKHKVDFAECFILTPYPGTDVYKYCVENNFFDGDVDTLQKSYWLGSCLRFDSERVKRRFVNFHKFFSFGVQHPQALPVIKFLIELPPNRLYVLFNRLYEAWRLSRVVRAKFNIRNFFITVRNNLRYIATYFLKA